MTTEALTPDLDPFTIGSVCAGTCGRTLIDRHLWSRIPEHIRTTHTDTHARAHCLKPQPLCGACYNQNRRAVAREPDPDADAWPEDAWVLRKGIWYPTGPRPRDPEPPRKDPELLDLFSAFSAIAMMREDATYDSQRDTD